MDDSGQVIELLREWRQGDALACDRLVPFVYAELRRLARGQLRRERAEHSLQPTALVHEAYLRLVTADVDWQDGNTVVVAAYACAADQLDRADAIMKELTTPILNKYTSAGKVVSWGYLAAYIGSQANRQIYVWAANPVALMQARQAYLPEIQASPRFAEFSKICGSASISLSNLLAVSAAPLSSQ
jgi:hypothetical protein